MSVLSWLPGQTAVFSLPRDSLLTANSRGIVIRNSSASPRGNSGTSLSHPLPWQVTGSLAELVVASEVVVEVSVGTGVSTPPFVVVLATVVVVEDSLDVWVPAVETTWL